METDHCQLGAWFAARRQPVFIEAARTRKPYGDTDSITRPRLVQIRLRLGYRIFHRWMCEFGRCFSIQSRFLDELQINRWSRADVCLHHYHHGISQSLGCFY